MFSEDELRELSIREIFKEIEKIKTSILKRKDKSENIYNSDLVRRNSLKKIEEYKDLLHIINNLLKEKLEDKKQLSGNVVKLFRAAPMMFRKFLNEKYNFETFESVYIDVVHAKRLSKIYKKQIIDEMKMPEKYIDYATGIEV